MLAGSVHPISAPQERRFLPAAPVGRLTSENRHQSAIPPRARARAHSAEEKVVLHLLGLTLASPSYLINITRGKNLYPPELTNSAGCPGLSSRLIYALVPLLNIG